MQQQEQEIETGLRNLAANLVRNRREWWKLFAIIAVGWGYLAFGAHAVWPGRCAGLNLNIEKGEIRSVQLGGNALAITAAFPDQKNAKVIVYDYCKGTVLSTIEANN